MPPDVAPVALDFNYEARNEPDYKINNSATSADTQCTSVSNLNTIGQCAAALLTIQQIFPARFLGAGEGLLTLLLGHEWTELYQIREGYWPIISTPKECSIDFRYIPSFRKQSASKVIGVENRGKISDCFTP